MPRVHLAFFMNENWRTYTAATIVHVSCTRPEFVRLPKKLTWTLDTPPDLVSRSQVLEVTPEVNGATFIGAEVSASNAGSYWGTCTNEIKATAECYYLLVGKRLINMR